MVRLHRSVAFLYLFLLLPVLSALKVQAQWEHKILGPTSLAFSPDGRWLAAGSIEGWLSPGDLYVWETRNGKLRHKTRYIYGVQAIAFSPDSKTLAVATYVEESKDAIRLWDVKTWQVHRTLGGKQYIYSVAFSPDGTHLAAGSNMGENGETDDAYFWNITRRQARVLPHSNGLAQLLFSPRNDLILGGFYAGYYNDNSENLRAWDGKGRFLWQHTQPGLNDIAFAAGGRSFITGIKITDKNNHHHGALQLWDATQGRLQHTINHPENVTAVAASPNGKLWASGDPKGTVRFWDTKTRRLVRTLRLHAGIINLAFSPNSRYLASTSRDSISYNGSIKLTRLH